MAEVTRTRPAGVAVEEGRELLPARKVDLRGALRTGLLGGAAAVLVSAIGMLHAFEGNRIVAELTLSSVILLAIGVGFGYLASRPPATLEGYAESRPGGRNLLAGALGGAGVALPVLAFVWIFGNVDLRWMFRNVRPADVERLTFDQGLLLGSVLAVAAAVVMAVVGSGLHLLPGVWRKPLVAGLTWIVVFGLTPVLVVQVLRGLQLGFLPRLLYLPTGALRLGGALGVGAFFFLLHFGLRRFRAPARQRLQRAGLLPDEAGQRSVANRALMLGVVGAGFFLFGAMPHIFGQFLSSVFVIAGIFMMAALGLNIVVGFAGLLDLGYVAFFAVGAYATAILTSPLSPRFSPELGFWQAMPFVIVAAMIAGVIVGTPVLRMRGDYLAIVTLAFGEIARVLLISDWLTPTFGGAQGIIRVPPVHLGPVALVSPQRQLYVVMAFILFAAYVTWALQRSRVGRAWMAMREDESVAEAMGVNIVAAKLSAFIIGAILASFAGALYVTRIGSAFPHDFDIIFSITVLVIIIVGGIASVPGVLVGALALAALPQLLREFDEFRFLIYGALLILMMLKRPEGFIPSRRRAQELHEEEAEQDVWLREVAAQERLEGVPAEAEPAPPAPEAEPAPPAPEAERGE
jgi:branched-chain amino acid transport system permease protein